MITHSSNEYLLLGGVLNRKEQALTAWMWKNLQGGVFLDVGAHHGFYSCLATKKGCKVHSFEASPLHARYCKINTGAVCQYAIGDTNTDTHLYNVQGAGSTLFNRAELDSEKIQVSQRTLDSFDTKPSYIKIDVEGAEYIVVMGALSTIKKFKPIIAIELWHNVYKNDEHIKAVHVLNELGYEPYALEVDGTEIPLTVESLLLRFAQGKMDNYIFKYAHRN